MNKLILTLSLLALSYVSAAEYRLIVATEKAGNIEYEILSVFSEKTQESLIEEMMATGNYHSIEADSVTKSFDDSTPKTNDPKAVNQYHLLEQDTENMGAQDGLRAMNVSQKNLNLRIGVIDGGFKAHPDITYSGGYSFLNSGSSNYSPKSSICDSHGLSVAGLISAKTNNGLGISGMIDAEIYVSESLNCSSSGSLNDAALGVYYLAGITQAELDTMSIPGEEKIKGFLPQAVHIINMSTGSEVNCPAYLQNAIDYAHQKNIFVVVAAGNESANASTSAPANCNNVIVSSAVNRYGNKSSFTNFGDLIDFSALGTDAFSLSGDNGYRHVSGTSFSTPITAASIGMIKQSFPALDNNRVEAALKLASGDFRKTVHSDSYSNDGVCTNECGAGVINPYSALKLISNSDGSLKNTGVVAIDAPTRSSDFLKKYFSSKYDFCSAIEVKTEAKEGGEYALYSFPKGSTLADENLTEITRTIDPVIILNGFDTANKGLAYKICVDGSIQCDLFEAREIVIPDSTC